MVFTGVSEQSQGWFGEPGVIEEVRILPERKRVVLVVARLRKVTQPKDYTSCGHFADSVATGAIDIRQSSITALSDMDALLLLV